MIRFMRMLGLLLLVLVAASDCRAQFQLSEPTPDESESSAGESQNSSKPTTKKRSSQRDQETSSEDRSEQPRTAPLRKTRNTQSSPGRTDTNETPSSTVKVPDPSLAVARDSRITLIDEDPDPGTFWSGPVPRRKSIAQDATLYDVCTIGSYVWAVGDQGVVCTSSDNGETWTTRMTPFPCRLTSVCFLTNRVGWVGGIRFDSATQGGRAVLLATRDGGESWKDLSEESRNTPGLIGAASQLPGILSLQYFGLDDAIAVTLPQTSNTAQTLFRSVDGGVSWEPVPADQPVAPWMGGAFISPDEGIVVGQRQQYASIVSREAVVVNAPSATLRSVRGASLDSTGHGWIAGDGGQILETTNGGVTWSVPSGELPEGLTDVFDACSVTHRDSVVMAAGLPASMVLRSEDSGNTWNVAPVPAHGQINRIKGSAENLFFAVGSFGQILRSIDDGATWECVRSAGFRSGVMSLVTEAQSAPIQLLSSLTSDAGVRSCVVQPSQVLDLSLPDAASSIPLSHADFALSSLSVEGVHADWAFPRTVRGQELSSKQLLAEWNRQTDGRLRELLPLRLARSLCTWRPVIIVVEPSSETDAVASVLADALTAAEKLAGSPEGTALEMAGLQAWSVSRVATRAPQTQRSSLSFDDSELLKSLGTTTGLLCDAAEALMHSGESFSVSVRPRAGYSILRDASDQVAAEHLLAGLERELTAEVRRPVSARQREQLEEMQRVVQSAKLEASALDAHQGLQKSEEAFVAELETIGASLPPALALRQLAELASLNLERNNIEGYLAIQQELMRRFPDSQEARRAAETLLVLYSSAEVRQHRTRLQSNPDAMNPQGAKSQAATAGVDETSQDGPQPIRMQPSVQPANSSAFSASATPQLTALNDKWNTQAQIAWTLLNRHEAGSPDGKHSVPSSAILRQAVSMRLQDKTGECSTLLTELSPRTDEFGLWATSEMQVLQGMTPTLLRTFNVPRSASRPYLDGVLTDDIWEQAEEISLEAPRVSGAAIKEANENNAQDAEQPRSLVMVAWDDQFLYVAGRFQRPAAMRRHVELASGRTHDADHGMLDRFELSIDTDRDYMTAFRLVVDESGQTTDSCWWLTRWNPRWYVACDGDDSTWRFEAAIPFQELSTSPVRPGILWSMKFRRNIPGVLEQELPPAAATTSLQGASLVRFIRPKLKTNTGR